ncbi:MAG: helix-turn-helix domain-containing protein [Clostridia bacterium]|nr:helix-turn-helix domain-containing protein [Clostridia bacterium]
MINKVHTGKRLSLLRRRLGYSQAALAELLGVTAQAVSKWECGTTLPDIELLLMLSRLYHVSINSLLEERDLLQELTGQAAAADGVAYFVPNTETPQEQAWAEAIIHNGWIARNWQSAQEQPDPVRHAVGTEIAALGGTILEIGAGPGGGFMPYILKADPDAQIIINDLSPTVVREWRKLLDRALDSPNLSYAAFNFCHMPLKDSCIDVISDGGGIGNTIGSKAEVLRECWRVLKPGGRLITSTGFVTRETLAALPDDTQHVLREQRPDIFEDLYEDTVLAGFTKIDSVISGCWYTDGDESDIADLARTLGVNLKFTSYIRYCTK